MKKWFIALATLNVLFSSCAKDCREDCPSDRFGPGPMEEECCKSRDSD